MLKKKLYKFHRSLSILIGIPVFLWAISGLLHPIMTNIRPVLTTQSAPVVPLDQSALHQSLSSALSERHIDNFYRARKIWMAGKWYEQIRLTSTAIPIYIQVNDGSLLKDGDQLYARFLASHFLSGNDHDTAAIRSVRYLTEFSGDYPSVNRILPVYQVEFDRADDLSIFVSTNQSQFSYASDNNRHAFNWFFGFFHTWSWLDQFPGWKAGIIALILLLTIVTTSIGLYFAFTTKSRPGNKHRLIKARRLHRLTALMAAFFTLAWAFSGAIHAVQNSLPELNGKLLSKELLNAQTLPSNPAILLDGLANNGPDANTDTLLNSHKQDHRLLDKQPWQITDIQYLSVRQQPFMRVIYQKSNIEKNTDLMKDQQVQAPHLLYYNLANHQILKEGDRAYAVSLAKAYLNKKYTREARAGFDWGNPSVLYQTGFDLDYNFSDKILPVWKISPDGKLSHTVYIQTKTGRLTKEPTVFGRVDAFSFGFFHKHEFMAWAGKSVKDASTIIGILLVLCMLFFGYRLYFLSRKQRKRRP